MFRPSRSASIPAARPTTNNQQPHETTAASQIEVEAGPAYISWVSCPGTYSFHAQPAHVKLTVSLATWGEAQVLQVDGADGDERDRGNDRGNDRPELGIAVWG